MRRSLLVVARRQQSPCAHGWGAAGDPRPLAEPEADAAAVRAGQDREHCDGLVIADIHGGAPRTLVPLKNYNAISDSVASCRRTVRRSRSSVTTRARLARTCLRRTGLHRVARNGWLGAWSPDSQRLSFVISEKGPSCGYGGRIQVVRTDMKGRRWVTRPGHLVCVRGLAWSPRGRYIAYLRTLRISRLDGKRERVLLKNAVVGLGSRSPDGRQLALERLTDFNAGTFALEIWNQAGRRQAILDHGRINVLARGASGSGGA
jgi:hypothetical protein